MNPRSKASPTILLTLAEFAWLVVFALLLLVKGTRTELQSSKAELQRSQVELAKAKSSQPMAERLEKLELARAGALKESSELKLKLRGLEDNLKSQAELVTKTEKDKKDALDQVKGLKQKLAEVEAKLKTLVALNDEASTNGVNPAGVINDLRKELAAQKRAAKELSLAAEKSARERAEAFAQAQQTGRDLAAFKAALHVNSPDEVAARLIQLKAREEKHAGLQADHEKLQADFKTLHGELQSRNAAELTVRQELIGIDAKRLKRVAILLDTSSSMTESSAWKDASRLIQLWLTHLQIEECVLISFNSTVHVYPKSGYLRIRTPEKKVVEENRKELLKQVKEAPFGRFTDTLGALKMAYSLNGVEMVLLFTDGRPQTEGSRYAKLAPQIFDLVKLHSDIPIVAVGLGDYEKLELEDKKADKSLQIHFLKEIARLSGGNFSAR